MRYRDHRGGLADSLATAVDMQGTKVCLAAYLNAPRDRITVEKYGHGIDKRCGWDTYIVAVDGCAVGFTDGPLEVEP